MKTIYVIKDITTNEYYWSYRADEGFCTEVNDATKFNSKEEKRLSKENETKNYWLIPEAKKIFGGMKVSIVKKMLYEYRDSYYSDKLNTIYNEDVLIKFVEL